MRAVFANRITLTLISDDLETSNDLADPPPVIWQKQLVAGKKQHP